MKKYTKNKCIKIIKGKYELIKLNESLPVMEVSGELTPSQKARRTIRHTLASVGFNEAVTYSLISPSRLDEFLINEGENVESIKFRIGNFRKIRPKNSVSWKRNCRKTNR